MAVSEITAAEAARRGYAAKRASLGPGGMAEKARKGGEALLARYGREWYAALGHKSHPRMIGAHGGRGRGPAAGAAYRRTGR